MMEIKINQNIEDFVKVYYMPKVVKGIDDIENNVLEEISDKVAQRIKGGRRIFAFGNGGSEAIAEAFVYSLEQKIGDNFKFDVYSNPKLSEATDAGISTLFNRRIRRSGRPGDLAVLVSASGNSDNIANASKACSSQSVEAISISGNGRVANDKECAADYPVVIKINDQQIIEDVILGAVYIIGKMAQYQVEGKKYDANKAKKRYTGELIRCFSQLPSHQIDELAKNIIQAHKRGKQIRIDAPDSGLLAINAGHMQHNLKWDAFQGINARPSNMVSSGLPTYHFSGVGNDGGEGFNYAIEINDNYNSGDLEIIFARNMCSNSVQALIRAAEMKRMAIHPFCFQTDSEYAASNLAQTALHLTSRVINAYLLSEAHQNNFAEQLRLDLAMLRQKDETERKLQGVYKNELPK